MLKEEARAALVRRAISPDFADFDYEELDATRLGPAEVLSAACQMPFGSERRLVVVRGMEQWRDRGRSADCERLAAGLTGLPSAACLVLIALAEEEEARRKTAVNARLDAAVRDAGGLVVCRGLRGDALVEWVIDRFRSEGKQIGRDAAEQLIHLAGEEMRPIEQEIQKLVCYAGDDSRITLVSVNAVTSAEPEDAVFAAVDAIVRRQPDRALSLIGELHRCDPRPQAVAGKLLALVTRQYRMLFQARVLLDRRVSARSVRAIPEEIAADLPQEGNIVQVAYRATDLFAQAKGYRLSDIAWAFDRLLACDLANKGGAEDAGAFGADPRRNLDILVVELTGAAGRRAA